MNRERAIDLISKLVAMAESTTFAGEAVSFRAKADELLARFDLKAEECKLADPDGITEKFRDTGYSRLRPKWLQFLGSGIANYCDVNSFDRRFWNPRERCPGNYFTVWVGAPSDVELCDFLFSVAHRAVLDKLKEFRRLQKATRRKLTVRQGRDYLEGVVRGLLAKLRTLKAEQKDSRPEDFALVPVKDKAVRRYCEARDYPMHEKVKISFNRLKSLGFHEGQKIELLSGLRHGQQVKEIA